MSRLNVVRAGEDDEYRPGLTDAERTDSVHAIMRVLTARCIITGLRIKRPLELQDFNSEYVARLASHDDETERHFAGYFGPLLTAKLRARLRSPDAVEDARQETLLRVLTTIRRDGGLRNPERLGAYVNAVCNNVLLETYRSQKRHGQPDEEAPEQIDSRPDPESEFVSFERKRLVREVLAELNPKDRDLLRAVFLEDRDKDEICRDIGVDNDYLRVLLHRARGRFKQLLLKRKEIRSVSHGL
jgi:RNA polymerase sigma-70 factor (ECF subfamily)